MSRKTVDDLDDDPASIGGAMSQWPRRTLTWICRETRTESLDPAVADALVAREVRDLAALSDAAGDVGISTATLDERRRALGEAAVSEVVSHLTMHYDGKYGSTGHAPADPCPFEESGLDKACWRCPVPGRTLDSLGGTVDIPAPEGSDP